MPTKKSKYCAPDPENNLKVPTEWNHTKMPWIAMDSDGGWYSYAGKPEYDDIKGCFTNTYVHRLWSTVRKGSYADHHFSKEICLETVQKYDSEKSDYCPICDGYGGTLQPCHGCGRPANSPCAVSLDSNLKKEKKKKKKTKYGKRL